jgi:hypothetical protein
MKTDDGKYSTNFERKISHMTHVTSMETMRRSKVRPIFGKFIVLGICTSRSFGRKRISSVYDYNLYFSHVTCVMSKEGGFPKLFPACS